jgi:hypothetical protein
VEYVSAGKSTDGRHTPGNRTGSEEHEHTVKSR